MGNITELSQGNLDGLKKQVCECIDHAQAQGYKEGYTKGQNDADKDLKEIQDSTYDEAYNKGIEDLVRAMKAYYPLNSAERLKYFGTNIPVDRYAIESSKDLVAMAKAYEEKKQAEEEIKVGDEVYLLDDTNPIIITRVSPEGLVGFSQRGKYAWYSYKERKDLHKTGRHFDEIEQVLDKLKG